MQKFTTYIISHKEVDYPTSEGYEIIYVGDAANSGLKNINDRNGDNISELNPYFCELTAQYWIWKNHFPSKDSNDLVGFCHYRRFFSFDSTSSTPTELMESGSRSAINSCLKDVEVILPEGITFPVKQHWFSWSKKTGKLKFPWGKATLLEQWQTGHQYESLILATEILPKNHKKGFLEHLNTYELHPYNMYIARVKVLNEYFSILFPWLFEYKEFLNKSVRSDINQSRLFGFISERFASYYFSRNHKFTTIPVKLIS